MLTLADTSAWIEYLRGTGSPVGTRVRSALAAGKLATTEVVIMEVLAGAADVPDRDRLRRLLRRFQLLHVGGLHTYESAGEIHRVCRSRSETIHRMTDCLIAAVAIREGAELLHHDRDFDAIARHTRLRVA